MSPNSPITLVPVVSAMPGIERRITYSGRGLANSINCSKTCSRRLVNLISFCALYLTSSIIGEVFEMPEYDCFANPTNFSAKLPILFSEIRLEVDWRKVSFNSTSDNSSTQYLVGKMETRFQYCSPIGVDSRFSISGKAT